MKSGRRHGFLCQSHASTAVCIPGDSRAVIVPRRPDRSPAPAPKLVDLKYSRLVGSGRYSAGCTGSDTRPLASNVLANVRRVRPSATAPPPPPRPPTTLAMAPAAVETGRARKDVTLIPAPSPAPAVTTYGDVFQVVVMRVSIHCQGCAYKVKKHISKMEGVTSFSIDLEKKRVTVMGHISPLGVLESISKVKKAEFWQG